MVHSCAAVYTRKMTSRQRVIWLNLGLLGLLLTAAIAACAVMAGSFGARMYADTLRQGSAAERFKAAEALESFDSSGAPAVPALLEVLRNPDDPSAPSCARAVREIDPQAAYEYVTGLIGNTDTLTPATTRVFGNFGPIAWRAIPLVRSALSRPSHAWAYGALIDMGDYDDELIAAIVKDARGGMDSWGARLALDRLGDVADRIQPSLLEHLTSDSTPVVSAMGRTIPGKIGGQSGYASSGLEGFPQSDRRYQEYALDRLSKQGGRGAEAILDILTELHSKSLLIRFTAVWTLMHIGPPARSALPELRAALHDPHSLVRDGAADAIRAIEATP